MSTDIERLRTEGPVKNTLHNLVQVLSIKLDLAARYGLYQEDARKDVDDEAAQLFLRIAEVELEHIAELQRFLGLRLHGDYGDASAETEHRGSRKADIEGDAYRHDDPRLAPGEREP